MDDNNHSNTVTMNDRLWLGQLSTPSTLRPGQKRKIDESLTWDDPLPKRPLHEGSLEDAMGALAISPGKYLAFRTEM